MGLPVKTLLTLLMLGSISAAAKADPMKNLKENVAETYKYYSLSPEEMALVKKRISARLPNPASAQFAGMQAVVTKSKAIMVCGLVSYKSGPFDTRGPNLPFAGLMGGTPTFFQPIGEVSNKRSAVLSMVSMCRGEGIKFSIR